MAIKSIVLVILLLSFTLWTRPGSLSAGKSHELSGDREENIEKLIQEKYNSLHESSLNPEAFRIAMLGYRTLLSTGYVKNDSLLTIIDFSRPSVENRFFVINLKISRVIYISLVSHGIKSGDLYASKFSNKVQSHQSTLGFSLTCEPYKGGQGYSLQLMGVDTGYNDHSKIRSIVIHGAGYATKEYAEKYGRLGRSFGCFALPPIMNTLVIDAIKGGSVLFSYFPDQSYLNHSVVLHNRFDRKPYQDYIPMNGASSASSF